jgi:quinol monooxygenase YgiN
MICVHVLLTIRDAALAPKIRDLLAEHSRLSKAEPGCLRFELYHSQADPKVFILAERWETEESLAVHRTARGYTTIYVPEVLPHVDRVAHRSELIVE